MTVGRERPKRVIGMHELSIATSILEIIKEEAARNNAIRVTKIKVAAGALTAVVPESLAFCFGICSRGTLAEGAVLECEVRPVSARCDVCGREFAVEGWSFLCPYCGSARTRMVAGQELYVDSFEVEQGCG